MMARNTGRGSTWGGTFPTGAPRDRYRQCDDTCTADCGACKGQGRPRPATEAEQAVERVRALAEEFANPTGSWDSRWIAERIRAVLDGKP